MEKKNSNKNKEQVKKGIENAQKKPKVKLPQGYQNGPLGPYKGSDGYLHCTYCRRRYEPGHRCNKPYK